MRYYIGPVGPRDAKLAVVAEKPGKDELGRLIQTGISEPLIGASGNAVNRHLRYAGYAREEVYLTNAVKHFDALGNPKDDDLKREQADLFMELISLPNLNCIIALGNAALLSLSNFHLDGVMRRRGSILQTAWGRKMIPSIHPAFYFRGEWRYKPVVDFDFVRAGEQARFRDYHEPELYCHVRPTFNDVREWFQFLSTQSRIAFDIELFRGSYISCLSFSHDGKNAFCIPFAYNNRVNYWNTDQELAIWQSINRLFAMPKVFYTHNGMFDCWHLWRHGISTPHMSNGFDTMYAHKLQAPDLPHDLAFVTSIYTEMPYYKDESGKWDTEITVPDEQFWGYNCKDSIATWQCAQGLQEDLAEYGMLEYYKTTVQPQWDPYMSMRQDGWKVDVPLLAQTRQRIMQEVASLESELKTVLGWIPNCNSPVDLEKVLKQLGISPNYTKTGKVQKSEKAMTAYSQRAYGDNRRTFLYFIDIKRRRTLQSNFLQLYLDDKEHYHASYNINHARTGRSSSTGADEGGPQLQNVPKSIRRVFIPDSSSHELWQADLKQAEAMIVAWDAQDLQLISAFQQGIDVHRVRACRAFRNWLSDEPPPKELLDSIRLVCDKCFSQGESECAHSERQQAKICGHALAYKMGIVRLLETLAKAGIFISKQEGERIKNVIVSRYILLWQNRIEWELRQSPVLVGPLGRKREFYGQLDDDMIRAALSWKAQHVVGDITNRAMIYLHKNLPKGARLRTQTHDSIVVNALKTQHDEISHLLDTAFNQTVYYHDRPLVIPIDKVVKESW